MKWFSRYNRDRQVIKKFRRAAFVGIIYEVWIERNFRIIKKYGREISVISKYIMFKVYVRVFFKCDFNLIILFLK